MGGTMAILTPAQMQKENVWNRINQILKDSNMIIAPKLEIHQGGIEFKLELLNRPIPMGPVGDPGPGGGNSHG
jgi:hypothetical protein